jgi:hypothetical protein
MVEWVLTSCRSVTYNGKAGFVLAIGTINYKQRWSFKTWKIVGGVSLRRNQKKLIEFYLLNCLPFEAIGVLSLGTWRSK